MPAILPAPVSSSAPAGLSAHLRGNRTSQHPWGFGRPPNCPLRLRENPLHDPLWSSPAISEQIASLIPQRAGIPNYKEGVITPSPGRPETSASPTWASAAVTGTFHTFRTVYLRLRRTLPDSPDLPPGLYSSTMDPSYKTHIRRTIQPLNIRLSSLRKSVHHNASVSNNKHCKLK